MIIIWSTDISVDSMATTTVDLTTVVAPVTSIETVTIDYVGIMTADSNAANDYGVTTTADSDRKLATDCEATTKIDPDADDREAIMIEDSSIVSVDSKAREKTTIDSPANSYVNEAVAYLTIMMTANKLAVDYAALAPAISTEPAADLVTTIAVDPYTEATFECVMTTESNVTFECEATKNDNLNGQAPVEYAVTMTVNSKGTNDVVMTVEFTRATIVSMMAKLVDPIGVMFECATTMVVNPTRVITTHTTSSSELSDSITDSVEMMTINLNRKATVNFTTTIIDRRTVEGLIITTISSDKSTTLDYVAVRINNPIVPLDCLTMIRDDLNGHSTIDGASTPAPAAMATSDSRTAVNYKVTTTFSNISAVDYLQLTSVEWNEEGISEYVATTTNMLTTNQKKAAAIDRVITMSVKLVDITRALNLNRLTMTTADSNAALNCKAMTNVDFDSDGTTADCTTSPTVDSTTGISCLPMTSVGSTVDSKETTAVDSSKTATAYATMTPIGSNGTKFVSSNVTMDCMTATKTSLARIATSARTETTTINSDGNKTIVCTTSMTVNPNKISVTSGAPTTAVPVDPSDQLAANGGGTVIISSIVQVPPSTVLSTEPTVVNTVTINAHFDEETTFVWRTVTPADSKQTAAVRAELMTIDLATVGRVVMTTVTLEGAATDNMEATTTNSTETVDCQAKTNTILDGKATNNCVAKTIVDSDWKTAVTCKMTVTVGSNGVTVDSMMIMPADLNEIALDYVTTNTADSQCAPKTTVDSNRLEPSCVAMMNVDSDHESDE
jgi:hypothetical protein